MNGRISKKTRKSVYGDRDFRDRKYYRNKDTGAIVADAFRDIYQKVKRDYKAA